MGLTIGIAGLPNVGKSTLFNALTRNSVLAANYPFATIEPNTGVVPLPDQRLDKLAGLVNAAKTIPATVTFVDIAGIVAGASQGEGMGNQFLANIREADAICQVVRAFELGDVVHVAGKVDPQADIETVNTELILADLQTLENVKAKLEKDVRLKKEGGEALKAVTKAIGALEAGEILYAKYCDNTEQLELLKPYQLMSAKPFIYVFNVDDAILSDTAKQAELAKLVAPAGCVFLNAEFEAQLTELEPTEVAEMLELQGVSESGLDQLARIGFTTLQLQTYLTAGEKEVRAWTIHKGYTAPKAAGVIHTDFEKGFIKAEVVTYADLMAAGSKVAAREQGKMRLEGKDYIMQDGDVVEFKFNV